MAFRYCQGFLYTVYCITATMFFVASLLQDYVITGMYRLCDFPTGYANVAVVSE